MRRPVRLESKGSRALMTAPGGGGTDVGDVSCRRGGRQKWRVRAVAVGRGVAEAEAVTVGVCVGTGVGVDVRVGRGVTVAVAVAVAARVLVAVVVGLSVAVALGRGVGVAATVRVGRLLRWVAGARCSCGPSVVADARSPGLPGARPPHFLLPLAFLFPSQTLSRTPPLSLPPAPPLLLSGRA